jgi:hypothetical protein
MNTGDRNTGDGNTGHMNTGGKNTGDGNTGDRNTGDGNTGHMNTGGKNTGDGNATNHSAGFFCQKEPLVLSFDTITKYTRKEYLEKYPEYNRLCKLLANDEAFVYSEFKTLPGWTLKKCKALHKKHIDGRSTKKPQQ